MKKVFLSLAVVAVLTVVSCKKETPATEEVVADTTAVAVDTTAVDTTAVAVDTTAADTTAVAK